MHAGARVDPGACIGPNVTVGAGARIGPGAVIDAGCYIGPEASVGEGTHFFANADPQAQHQPTLEEEQGTSRVEKDGGARGSPRVEGPHDGEAAPVA